MATACLVQDLHLFTLKMQSKFKRIGHAVAELRRKDQALLTHTDSE